MTYNGGSSNDYGHNVLLELITEVVDNPDFYLTKLLPGNRIPWNFYAYGSNLESNRSKMFPDHWSLSYAKFVTFKAALCWQGYFVSKESGDSHIFEFLDHNEISNYNQNPYYYGNRNDLTKLFTEP